MPAGCHPTEHNPCILGGFSASWAWGRADWGPGMGRMRVGTFQLAPLGIRELGYAPSLAPLSVGVPDWQSWGSVPLPRSLSLLHPRLSVSPLGVISPPGGLTAPLLLPPSPCPQCSAAVPGCAAAPGLNQALPVPWEPCFKKRRKGKNTLNSFGKHGSAGPVSILRTQGPPCLLWGVFSLQKAPCHPPQPWATDPRLAFPPSFPAFSPGQASRARVSV